jgi:hypothetical protein
MLRKLILICACLCSVPALCQSVGRTKYQVATVLTVNPHYSDANTYSSAPSYDVAVQVGNTVYVVLYTPRFGLQTAKYAAGRQVLVLGRRKELDLQRHLWRYGRATDSSSQGRRSRAQPIGAVG